MVEPHVRLTVACVLTGSLLAHRTNGRAYGRVVPKLAHFPTSSFRFSWNLVWLFYINFCEELASLRYLSWIVSEIWATNQGKGRSKIGRDFTNFWLGVLRVTGWTWQIPECCVWLEADIVQCIHADARVLPHARSPSKTSATRHTTVLQTYSRTSHLCHTHTQLPSQPTDGWDIWKCNKIKRFNWNYSCLQWYW